MLLNIDNQSIKYLAAGAGGEDGGSEHMKPIYH